MYRSNSTRTSNERIQTRSLAFFDIKQNSTNNNIEVSLNKTLLPFISSSIANYSTRSVFANEVLKIFDGAFSGISGRGIYCTAEITNNPVSDNNNKLARYFKVSVVHDKFREFVDILFAVTDNKAVRALAHELENIDKSIPTQIFRHSNNLTVESRLEHTGCHIIGANMPRKTFGLELSLAFIRRIAGSSSDQEITDIFSKLADILDLDVDEEDIDEQLEHEVGGKNDHLQTMQEEEFDDRFGVGTEEKELEIV